MAAAQLEACLAQLPSALPLPWLQQQDAFAIESGFPQPALCEAGGRRRQGQPACVLVLAQFAQNRRQQVQAMAGGAAQSQFAECLIILAAGNVIGNLGLACDTGKKGVEKGKLWTLERLLHLHGVSSAADYTDTQTFDD